jgi:hypothetical protein
MVVGMVSLLDGVNEARGAGLPASLERRVTGVKTL